MAYGDEGAIAAWISERHAAGADHVCLCVLGDPESGQAEALPLDAWRRLSPAVVSTWASGCV